MRAGFAGHGWTPAAIAHENASMTKQLDSNVALKTGGT
jgi:hypothetical protein